MTSFFTFVLGALRSTQLQVQQVSWYVKTKKKVDWDVTAFTCHEKIEPQTDPQMNRTQTPSRGGLSTVSFGGLLGGSEIPWTFHIFMLNCLESIWRCENLMTFGNKSQGRSWQNYLMWPLSLHIEPWGKRPFQNNFLDSSRTAKQITISFHSKRGRKKTRNLLVVGVHSIQHGTMQLYAKMQLLSLPFHLNCL